MSGNYTVGRLCFLLRAKLVIVKYITVFLVLRQCASISMSAEFVATVAALFIFIAFFLVISILKIIKIYVNREEKTQEVVFLDIEKKKLVF